MTDIAASLYVTFICLNIIYFFYHIILACFWHEILYKLDLLITGLLDGAKDIWRKTSSGCSCSCSPFSCTFSCSYNVDLLDQLEGQHSGDIDSGNVCVVGNLVNGKSDIIDGDGGGVESNKIIVCEVHTPNSIEHRDNAG